MRFYRPSYSWGSWYVRVPDLVDFVANDLVGGGMGESGIIYRNLVINIHGAPSLGRYLVRSYSRFIGRSIDYPYRMQMHTYRQLLTISV